MTWMTLRTTLLTLSLLIFIGKSSSWIHDGFVPDMVNPDQMIQCYSGKRLIPVQMGKPNSQHSQPGDIYITQKPVSIKEFLAFTKSARVHISPGLADLNRSEKNTIIRGTQYEEARAYCQYYGMDIPSIEELHSMKEIHESRGWFPTSSDEPDFEWSRDQTNQSSADHRRITFSRRNISEVPKSMRTRDQNIGFRCVFQPQSPGVTELLLGYDKIKMGDTAEKLHYLRIETDPPGVELFEDAHLRHPLGKTPFFGSFAKSLSSFVLKGNEVLPKTIEVRTPPGKGQVLYIAMKEIQSQTYLDSRRLAQMKLIPQGALRVGLNFEERERIQARILSKDGNADLDEERTRIYLGNEGLDRNFLLSDFYMDQTEVTNEQYQNYVRLSGHSDSRCSHVGNLSRPSAPVVCINWTEAQAFCRYYGLELPTEVQFEKAMRGVEDQQKRPWHKRPQPAGKRSWDRSSYGILDLGGNVMEWTADWFDPELYSSGFIINPKPAKLVRKKKTIKGSSYSEHRLDQRNSKRRHKRPSHYAVDLGFRCVKNL